MAGQPSSPEDGTLLPVNIDSSQQFPLLSTNSNANPSATRSSHIVSQRAVIIPFKGSSSTRNITGNSAEGSTKGVATPANQHDAHNMEKSVAAHSNNSRVSHGKEPMHAADNPKPTYA